MYTKTAEEILFAIGTFQIVLILNSTGLKGLYDQLISLNLKLSACSVVRLLKFHLVNVVKMLSCKKF